MSQSSPHQAVTELPGRGVWRRLPWWWKATIFAVLGYVGVVSGLAFVELSQTATFTRTNKWLSWITRPGVIIGAPWLCWLCTYYEAGNPFVRPKLKPAICARWLRRIIWAPPILLAALFLADVVVMVLWVTRIGVTVDSMAIAVPLVAYLAGISAAVFISWRLCRSIVRRYRKSIADMSLCFACGYDLRGNPGAEVCSECGFALESDPA